MFLQLYYNTAEEVCLLSIPFYFAMEENEATPQDGTQYAQLGFGFRENGTLRLPSQRIPGAPAVINDRFLPENAPEPAVLDQLAEACENGCILDFERPVNEVSAAIAVGLQRRLRGKITVPPGLYRLCPEADTLIPGKLCNRWEGFVQSVQEQYGARWALEIIPWEFSVPLTIPNAKDDTLKSAFCRYRTEKGRIVYFDTQDTIRQKLAVAQAHGCQAGIVLLREYPKT